MDQNRLKEQLKKLTLHTILDIYEEEAKRAIKTKLSYSGYLARLIEEEILAKTDRSINAKIAKAKFPWRKTIEEFDFKFQKSLDERLIRELAELSFLEKAANILFVGAPGVGKTHLSIGLGIKACQARKRVLFTKAGELIEELAICKFNRTLPQRLDLLSRLDCLIIDEIGYIPIQKEGANLFFQLISRRYEHGSVIITTNKAFEEWGEVFGDDVIASAILDRLLHHSHIIPINGPSFRTHKKIDPKKENQKQLKNE